MRDGEDNPRIPIGGSGGAIILQALKRLALHAGEISITITKRRTGSGGYTYVITHRESGDMESNHG